MGSIRVDIEAVRTVAKRYRAVADLLGAACRSPLRGLRFDGSTAGRAHVADGDELHVALATLATGVERWSRAAAEVAATLSMESDRQTGADQQSAALIA